jgi:hypothetical protein
MGNGGCLCCDFLERSDLSFIGSGEVAEQLAVEVEQSSYSRSTEQYVSDS